MPRVVLALVAVLALAACGGDESSSGPATGAAAEPRVSLAGQTLDGESLSLEEFRGKPLFVNVWASW
ncbi:MAG: TlpA family protein disulfide reductase [Gaiellaceae bacterium]